MEALMFLVDICAMFMLVRWSAKSDATPSKRHTNAAGDPPAFGEQE